ncbi:HBS1-like protein [Chytridiales sp. JEL 0842]|nr:HBS1-like protein [Chytridiales sp. JEL 0842]
MQFEDYDDGFDDEEDYGEDYDDEENYNDAEEEEEPQVAYIAPTAAASGGVGMSFPKDVKHSGEVKPFTFTAPSPDDKVKAARSGGGGTTKQTTMSLDAKKTSTTSQKLEPKPPAALSQQTASSNKSSQESLPKPAATVKASSKSTKKIDVLAEYAKRKIEKDSLNLVVIGHVDAGKSTIMGHLLFLLGEVDDRTMKKYEREAEKMKKGSFAYAWVLDETDEERSRGVTIDVAITKFETKNRKFTLLDAPGHKDFVPNMISGASQADVAMLVVDSTPGEFESGFDHGGQTREHALLARSLGVSQLLVAVNKMDTADWAQHRFIHIQEKLTAFLVSAGFRKEKIEFIPCSGYSGENLTKQTNPSLLSWYSGPTVVDCLDRLEIPIRPIEKPFRLSIVDLFKGGLSAGAGGAVSVSGRIEAGSVQIGDQVTVMPIGEMGSVKAIEIAHNTSKWAVAGDNVIITLNGIDIQQINVGNVICGSGNLIPVSTHFRGTIVTFDIDIPITIGVPAVLHHQSAHESCKIVKLCSIVNKSTGEVVKKNPRALPKNVTAIVEIMVDRPICIETAKECKELGRFMLRSGPSVIAAGIVTDILNRIK